MLVISLILPILAAFLAVCYLWQEQDESSNAFPLKCSFAIGIGLGLASGTYFVCLLLFNSKSVFSYIFEYFFYFIIIFLTYFRIRTHKKTSSNLQKQSTKLTKRNKILLGSFGIVLLLSVLYFLLISMNSKHGGWDAWAIWNMRARFLFRSGDQWKDAFSAIYAWSHPDYPLLIPINISRGWNYLGNDTVIVPITIAFLFTFLTIGLMVSSLSYTRSPNHGILAGLVFMGFTKFIQNGATQCADIPFAFYLLATIVLFYLDDKAKKKDHNYLILAGTMAGLGAWTKNEGLLLVLSVFIAYVLMTISKISWRQYLKELRAFIIGLFPIVILLAYFKFQLVPSNDLVAGQAINTTTARLLDLSRYVVVGKTFFLEFFEILKGRIIIFPALFLFLGFSSSRIFKKNNYQSIIILLLMLSGYFMVYIITPHDLNWHLNTSLERLFLQLLPSVIFIFFMNLNKLEVITRTKNESTRT